ncbi:MAG: ATP-binding protein [Bacteroidetes bacterium]|nr:ATP-binding protein [Bacteroidota bacterium]
MDNSSHNILLLDGDEQSAIDIQRFLKVSAYTFTVSHASTLLEGVNYLKSRKPDVVLLDATFAEGREFAPFKQFMAKENVPFILLSETGNNETQKQAERSGAADYLVKNKINLFHLQKSIVNALKLSEAEAKLDNTFNEFVAQHDTLYKLLNRMDAGVLVVNAQNAIRYANAKAYSILGDESIRKHLSDYLGYREIEEDEVIDLKPRKNLSLQIKISELDWNGERTNLFLLERTKKNDKSNEAFYADENLLTLINSINENVLVLKGDKIVLANKPALKQLKLKLSELNALTLSDIFESSEPLFEGISIQNFLAEKRAQGSLRMRDGSTVAVSFSIKPMNIADEFYQVLSFENRIEKENIPAQRSGDDDAFNTEGVLHLASHDLREPVRTILNYTQLISENLSQKKYEQAMEYTAFAQDAAERMEKLLSDLKTYIGLNDYKFQLGKVSMKLVLADVLKQLKSKIDEAGAEISFTELPDVNADRELVEKLVYHLIDNALKFRKKTKKPVIDIGFDKFEGNVIFCVRDNGIGISKKYYNKIFELFERLNRVDEYTGNGLGLAISKKITDMHGGELWVESLPGSGSNFYFTLRGK